VSRGSQRLSLQSAGWQVKHDGRWQDLGAEACRRLFQAETTGEQLIEIGSGAVTYEVNLLEMTQTNLKTKKVRELRKRPPD